ncbi:hypothetical protein H6G00_01595 [Leptolyngbya sp. FACHB-541]|uniref:hypothetical protein n=1 Tax=Leptolyngbya sp. FACHB-541 TaxID=2692810 RepID=UPI0016858581|nr:hypothetical protein [Leptolyngbya sp. FACHB-541]MBD1995324.1 hypothetical protein [Leptolyngbya sp. FACHB-541]
MTLTLVEFAEKLEALGGEARALLESPDLDAHQRRKITLRYETELIQTAACTVNALMDLRLQQGGDRQKLEQEIWLEIQLEKARADEKFGEQPRKLDPLVWLAVILEELSEVGEEIYG